MKIKKKKQREKTQITKLNNERGNSITYSTNIKVVSNFMHLNSTTSMNIKNSLKKCKLPKFIQEDITQIAYLLKKLNLWLKTFPQRNITF